MKIFIDSADINEIEKAYSYGILDGVTTNPSLIKKAAEKNKIKNMGVYIKKILKAAKKTPVSLEVIGTDYKSMVEEGKRLFKKFKSSGNVYIKIPIDPCLKQSCDNSSDGIKAIKTLSKSKIPVNCTLIFTPEQALLASKAGAKFISPFAGRIDDYIRKNAHIKFDKSDYFPKKGLKKGKKILEDNGIVSGVDLVKECVLVLKENKMKTKVLAASIRNPRQFREVKLIGADIATLPFKVIEKLLYHYKTAEGMKNFIKDVVPEYKKILKKK